MEGTPDMETEIVISGGGMVGLTLALALAQGGLSSVVVDNLPLDLQQTSAFDGRNSAIAAAGCRMFKALGLWPDLAPHAQPINDILVTDGRAGESPSPFFLHFDHRDAGQEPLGHLIENRFTRIALGRAAAANPLITVLAPAQATQWDGTCLTLADGRRIKAKLAVACEGRRSILRDQAGIKIWTKDYGQTGIVATVNHTHDHEGIAQEYFLPGGPFAILPLPGRRSSLVWTERHGDARALLSLGEDDFNHEMRRRFGAYLGDARVDGPRWSYPLSVMVAQSLTGPRLVLAGDTAHGMHPIAGQGFNLGLRDVAALAEVLTARVRLGLDPGAPDCLEEYARWRRFDTMALLAVTDLLVHLFSNDLSPLRLVRDAGLAVVNAVRPARRFFMRHAAGDVGQLPKLLRGEAL